MRFPQRLRYFVPILILLVLLPACGQRAAGLATPAPGGAPAVLGLVVNQVQLSPSAGAAFQPALQGAPLISGSQLQTADASQARVDLQAGGLLRLAANSDLALAALPDPGGDLTTRLRLTAGKLWAALPGGTLLVSTPMGVATLHGVRASLEYVPGRAGDPADDILILNCLDGDCTVQTEALRESLGPLEQLVVTGGSQSVRFSLTDTALADFLAQNPESAGIATVLQTPAPASATPGSPTVAATSIASDTPTLALPTAPSSTPAPPTAPPAPSATIQPGGVLGQHVVQDGETIYCIARGYGVLPDAIIQTNGLTPPFAIFTGQVLTIPAVPWQAPDGIRCTPQFTPLGGGSAGPSATPGALPSLAPPTLTTPAGTAEGPTSPSAWALPINLSQSSAASQPVLAVTSNGNYYALWWDHFAGTRFAVSRPGAGWSAAGDALPIVGATPAVPGGLSTAPIGLRLLAANDHPLHALWLTTDGYLTYSQNPQPASSGTWLGSGRLAAGLVAWDAVLGPDGSLHLAYLQAGQSSDAQAGVYYQRLSPGAGQWDPPRLLAASLYFRTLPAAEAHVAVAAGEDGQVYVSWDDPQLLYSLSTHSPDGGSNWDGPVPVSDPSSGGDLPRRLQFLPLPGGGWLRLWETSLSCGLYQQPYAADTASWGAPVRVLEGLSGCLGRADVYPLAPGQIALWASLRSGEVPSVLAVWDGGRWSQPWLPRINFVNPATNRPAALDCLQAALTGQQVVALGCDSRGDVWATVSQVSVGNLLPAGTSDWSPLQTVSDPESESGAPGLVADPQGRLHAAWAQARPNIPDDQPIFYARRDGGAWSPPAQILQLSDGGPTHAPEFSFDPRGWLHAVWSGGPSGQIYYSRAFLRDSALDSGWSVPVALPAPQPAGGSPAINLDPTGRLRVAFTIPLNEDRGVYLTESTDAGASWSAARLVFNAAQAGWAAVQDTQLAVDAGGRLHLLIVRGSLPPSTQPLGVYYLRSTDDGQSWNNPLLISTGSAGFPRLAASGTGEVHRLWVQPGADQAAVLHQWSPDGGQTWSPVSTVPTPRRVEPNLGLASDAGGGLYLTGIEAGQQDSASLFYLRWDGSQWTDPQNLALGYAADAGSGAAAILLPGGRLAVLSRVTSFAGLASGLHVLAYTERQVPAVDQPASPTLTPAPTAVASATTAPSPTWTPIPTVAPVAPPAASTSNELWLRIALILAAMLLVVLVAFQRLRSSRHYP